MMTDPIADMLTRIRNANEIERPLVEMSGQQTAGQVPGTSVETVGLAPRTAAKSAKPSADRPRIL